MKLNFTNRLTLFFFCLICTFDSTLATTLVPENFLGSQDDLIFEARLHYVFPNQQKVLFASRSADIPDYSGPDLTNEISNSNRELHYFVKDLTNNQITLMSQTVEGVPAREVNIGSNHNSLTNEGFYFEYFGDTAPMGYVAPENWGEVDTTLFFYQFDTGNITAIPQYGNTNTRLWNMHISAGGYIVFYNRTNQNYLKYSPVINQWQETPIQDVCNEANVELSDTDENNNILIVCRGYRGVNLTFLFNLENNSVTPIVSQQLEDTMAGDDRKLLRNGAFIVGESSANENAFVRYDIENNNVEIHDMSEFQLNVNRYASLSADGSSMIFSATTSNNIINVEDTQRFNRNSENHYFYYNFNSRLRPIRINIKSQTINDQPGFTTLKIRSNYFGDVYQQEHKIYFTGVIDSGGINVFVIEKDALDNYQVDFSQNSAGLQVIPRAPHNNEITISSDENFSGIYRVYRNNGMDPSDTFWVHTTQYSDYLMGAQPGNNTYSVVMCSFNFWCADTVADTTNIHTLDFPVNDDWQADFSTTDLLYDYKIYADINNLGWGSDTRHRVRLFNTAQTIDYFSDNIEFSLGDNWGSLKIGIQPCTANPLSNDPVCSENISIKNFELPNLINPKLLISLDYDYVSVAFEEKPGIKYSIERRIQDQTEFETLVEDASSGWQDRDISAGERYYYRVTACEEKFSICRHGPIQNTLITRGSPFSTAYRDRLNGSILLLVNSKLDFPEIAISRSDAYSGYTEVARFHGPSFVLKDVNLLPATLYQYRIQGLKDGEVRHEQFFEVFTSRRSNDVFNVSPIPELTVDSSFAFGHLLNWQEIDGASGYRIKAFNTDLWNQNSFFDVEGQSTTEFFFQFKDTLPIHGTRLYTVEPIFNKCEGCPTINVPELAAQIEGPELSLVIAEKQLYPIKFHTEQVSNEALRLNITDDYLSDYYVISLKQEGQTSWKKVAHQNATRYNLNAITLDISNLESGKSYDVQLEACSYTLKTCAVSASSTPVTVITQKFSGAPAVPDVTYSDHQFVMDLNIPGGSFIRHVEVKLEWGNSSSYIERFSDFMSPAVISRPRDLEEGSIVRLKARYCFTGGSFPDCTDYSEEIELELSQSNTERTLPPILNSLADPVIIENLQSLQISGSFRDNTSYDSPDRIEWFRATNNSYFELLHVDDIGASQNNSFQFSDTSVETGNRYQYAARICNEAGCNSRTSSMLLFAPPDQGVPHTPEVSEVSQGQFIDRVQFTLKPWFSNLRYTVYRSTSEDSEFTPTGVSVYKATVTDVFLDSDSTYYYRVQACNDSGCSTSETFTATTATNYYSGELRVTGDMLIDTSFNSSKVALSGSVSSHEGVLDAIRGEIVFNQWLDTSKGLQINTTSRLDGNWSNCSSLLSYKLRLPNINSNSRYQLHEKPLFTVVYTGNGCENNPELELFSTYILSDYISAPLMLEKEIREQWLSFELALQESGLMKLTIDGETLLTTSRPIEFDVLGISKLVLDTHSRSRWSEETLLSEASLVVNAITEVRKDTELAFYSPFVNSIHPHNLAITANTLTGTELEYLFVESNAYSATNKIEVHSGGRYNGYINNLTPGAEYELLMRRCLDNNCGPYGYTKISSTIYVELTSTPPLTASISDSDYSILLNLSPLYSGRIDQYIIYRQISNVDDTMVEIRRFNFDFVMQHWLSSDGNIELSDVLEFGQSATYGLEVCNPIGCYLQSSAAQITVPPDTDNDGVPDPDDAFPEDPNEAEDTDNDGIGNNADPDDDGDGIPDQTEIELGFDPLDPLDLLGDSDSDGFSDNFELLVGSDFLNSEDTPENNNYGVFTSFETPFERHFGISENGNRISTNGYDNFSIQTTFEESGMPDLTFTIIGKLKDGYIVFSELFTRSRSVRLYINGVEQDLTAAPFHIVGYSESGWHTVGFPIEGREEEVTLELTFNGFGRSFPTTVYIDRVFVPMTAPVTFNSGKSVADFDGDGKTDIATRNGSIGRNYVVNSSNSETQEVDFGSKAEDIQVAGDFDGDGLADFAVRRPSNGHWYIRNSSGSNYNSERGDGIQRVHFGKQTDDIPVPADYDGDGITDVAVRRASNSMWYIQNSSGSNYNSSREDGIQRVRFGLQEGDIPVPADYDGDGKADIAFRRPLNSTWYILESTTGEIRRIRFGLNATDIPVPADFDGDGKADIAVRRAANSMWYILQSSDGAIRRVKFGLQEADIPVVGDYDGDGKADVAFRRDNNETWYILNSSDNEIQRIKFGQSTGVLPLLTPIWEKLLRLGWESDYIFSATLNHDGITFEDETEYLEQQTYFAHPEYLADEMSHTEQAH